MGVPKRTPAELEPAYVKAYELKCRGMTYDQVAAELKGTPYWCGGRSTAFDWVKRGQALILDEDSLRGRKARREMSADAIDALRVQLEEETKAGLVDRLGARRLQLEAIRLSMQLLGLRAASQADRARSAGGGAPPPRIPEPLLDALAAFVADEQDPDREDRP